MDLTLAPSRGRPRPVLLGALLLFVALVAVALVGVRAFVAGPRPAAPFGPAVNGALYYAKDGVFRIDSLTGTPESIISESRAKVVLPSKDGTAIVVVRQASDGWRLAVSDPDGRNLHDLSGTYRDFSEIDWSPSGGEVAIISDVAGARAITVLAADGSTARTLDLGMQPDAFWYLPDGHILYKGDVKSGLGPHGYGLYTVDPADSRVSVVVPPSPEDSAIIEAAPSADGTSVVYHAAGGVNEEGRVRLMDIDGGNDRPLSVAYPNEPFADQSASFSPDGRQVLFTRFTTPGNTLELAPVTGGAPRAIGEFIPGNDMAVAAFSPDGMSVIAYYPNGDLWLLDATGSGTDRQLDLPVSDMPTWQRLGR